LWFSLSLALAAYEFRAHDRDKKAPERDSDREGKGAEVGRLGLIDDSSKKVRTNEPRKVAYLVDDSDADYGSSGG
jgi:hypothetical protein